MKASAGVRLWILACLLWLPGAARAEMREGYLAQCRGLVGLFYRNAEQRFCFVVVVGRDAKLTAQLSVLAKHVRYLTEVAYDAPFVQLKGAIARGPDFVVDEIRAKEARSLIRQANFRLLNEKAGARKP